MAEATPEVPEDIASVDTPVVEEPSTPETPAPVTPTPEVKDWKEALPEDLRSDPTIKDIADVPSLAKSLVHAQKLIGMDRNKLLTVPSEDATPEEWDSFYKQAGRPDTPDAYSIEFPKDLEEKVERNEDMEKWYKDTAHKLGLSKRQGEELYKEFMTWTADGSEVAGQHLLKLREDGIAALKKEWGVAYETNMKTSVAPLKQFADEEFINMLDDTGLGSHPAMASFLFKVQKALGEDTVNDATKSEHLMTPSEATAEIAKKFNDPTFMAAYRDGKHTSHKWAVEEMSKLYKFQTSGS